jgi:RNA-directed DNA polymerase
VNAHKANNTIDKVRQLQRKLYLAAKVNKKRRFHALYDKIYRKDVLLKAWNQVKANAGSAGIDSQTIEDVKTYGEAKFLAEIEKELLEGTYQATPVKRVYIPKKDGGKRPLGIPIVKDRVVQAAAKIIIEPVFEADFKECSYGFRPKRNAHMALDKIKDLCHQSYYWILDADIKGYFNSISHNKLLMLVEMRVSDRRIVSLIRKWLTAGVMDGAELEESKIGSPQGGVISPLLSNIYLNYLDTLWERHYKHLGELIRYCDDFVIVCKKYKELKHAEKCVNDVLARLELELHEEKTRIVNNWLGQPGFDFLGFHHKKIAAERKDGTIRVFASRWPSKKSMSKMREKIRNLLGKRPSFGKSLDDMVKEINRVLRGFKNYYAIGKGDKLKLAQIDDYVLLRFVLWSNGKKQKSYRRGNMRQIHQLLKLKGIVKLAA